MPCRLLPQGPAITFARYCARTPVTRVPADGAISAIVNDGATLYVTVMELPGGIVNVPVVKPVLTPPTEIAVTVPPVIVTLTGTGFGFSDATVDAASVIAVVNISGAVVTTALAESRIAPAST